MIRDLPKFWQEKDFRRLLAVYGADFVAFLR